MLCLRERAMLGKCANPGCSEVFRYLHEGKIFHLCPTPEVQAATEVFRPLLFERFWLCDKCSKQMTLVWGGTQAKLVSLPPQTEETEETGLLPLLAAFQHASGDEMSGGRRRARAAYAGRDNG